jgi:hypothetical protein
MPNETEVKNIEIAVITDIEKVEAPVVAKAEELKTEVVDEVKKVTNWPAKKLADVKLDAVDHSAFADLENAFLRAHLKMAEANKAVADATKEVERHAKTAQQMVASFIEKYGIDPAKQVFVDAERAFKSL